MTLCLVHNVNWEPEGCPICIAEFKYYQRCTEAADAQTKLLQEQLKAADELAEAAGKFHQHHYCGLPGCELQKALTVYERLRDEKARGRK